MTTLVLREVDPPLRHKLVLETFHKMRPGEELEVIADHYPAHLLQLISGKIKKSEVKESGEGIFVLKLIKGGEEPRPIVSRLSDYRKSGETFTPIPVIRKDEYGAILVF